MATIPARARSGQPKKSWYRGWLWTVSALSRSDEQALLSHDEAAGSDQSAMTIGGMSAGLLSYVVLGPKVIGERLRVFTERGHCPLCDDSRCDRYGGRIERSLSGSEGFSFLTRPSASSQSPASMPVRSLIVCSAYRIDSRSAAPRRRRRTPHSRSSRRVELCRGDEPLLRPSPFASRRATARARVSRSGALRSSSQ